MMLLRTLRNSPPGLRITLIGLLLGMLALAWPTPSDAQVTADPNYWKQTEQRRESVRRFFYRQAPQPLPAAYDPVAEAESITLEAAQREASPANPKARGLWQRTRTILGRGRLAPLPRALGVIGLAATTGELGWRIGSGVNQRFLRIGLNASPPPTGKFEKPQIQFYSAGQTAPIWHSIRVPEDGWVWSTWSADYANQRSAEYWSGENPACRSAGPPPEGFKVVAGLAGMTCNAQLPHRRLLAYMPENDLRALGPMVPYTGQPYDRWTGAPTPPSAAELDQIIESELAKPENDLVRRWLNHHLGSPGEEDPLIGTVPSCRARPLPDCKEALRVAGFENFTTVERATPDYEVAPAAVIATTPGPGEKRDLGTDIRIEVNPRHEPGTDDRAEADCEDAKESDPGYRDPFELVAPYWFNVAGRSTQSPFYWGTPYWGYRKIKVWHGWNAAKENRTALALLGPPVPDVVESPQPNPWPRGDGSYAYYHFWTSANGHTHCTTMVIMRFDIDPAASHLPPKHVLNSFAYPGWLQKSPAEVPSSG